MTVFRPVTCRVLRFSPQGYYKWLKAPCSKRDYDNAHLTNALIDLHRDDPTFGYRFMADELEMLDESVSERRVWRLCSEMSIFSAFTKKGRAAKKPGAPVHDDLVQRNFTASRPNENTNGLLCQYFPKGTDVSRWTAEELEAVAHALNTRPRKTRGWKTPAEVLDEHLRLAQQASVASTD